METLKKFIKKLFGLNTASPLSDSEKLELEMELNQLKRAIHLIRNHCDSSKIQGEGLGAGVAAQKENRNIALYSGGENDWFVDMWVIHSDGEEEFFYEDIQSDSFMDAVKEIKLWLDKGEVPNSSK